MRRRTAAVILLLASLLALVAAGRWLWHTETASLLGCRVVTAKEAREEMAGRRAGGKENFELLFNHLPLPYDRATACYYMTQSPQSGSWSGTLSLADTSQTLLLIRQDASDKAALIAAGDVALTGVLLSEELYAEISIVAVGLPTMSITADTQLFESQTASAQDAVSAADAEGSGGVANENGSETTAVTADREEAYGSFALFSMLEGQVQTWDGSLSLHARGKTQLFNPKGSLRLHLLDKNGNKKNQDLLFMRSDDDWILNSLYGDGSKLRDALSLQVWNDIAAVDGVPHDNGSRLSYVELFVNDSYCGLYGLQEPLDAKQAELNVRTDYFYRSVQLNYIGAIDFPLGSEADTGYGEATLAAGHTGAGIWEPMQVFLDVTWRSWRDRRYVDPDVLARIASVENIVDYYLFKQVTAATDNGVKNTSYAAYADLSALNGLRMVRIPWDTNFTFGTSYSGAKAASGFTEYVAGWETAQPDFDPLFSFVFLCSQEKAISLLEDRWALLSAGALDGERIAANARELHARLEASGALARDRTLWNEEETDIDAFCESILLRCDYIASYVEAVSAQPEAEYWRLFEQILAN